MTFRKTKSIDNRPSWHPLRLCDKFGSQGDQIGTKSGPSLARSREPRPNRRACSQASETIVTVQANFIFEFSAFGCYQGHCSVLRAHGDIKHVLCVLLGTWRVLLLKEWLFPVGNDVAVLLGDGGESWGKVFSYGWVKVRYVKGDKCVARSLENPTNKLLRNYFWGKYFQFQKTLDSQRLPTNFDRKPSIRESALLNTTTKRKKKVLRPFVTQYQPSVSTLKEVFMKKWNLIKTNRYFAKCLKNHLSFPSRKENL